MSHRLGVTSQNRSTGVVPKMILKAQRTIGFRDCGSDELQSLPRRRW